MSTLFERAYIGNMSLANRFVRSATWEGMATEEGAVTQQMIDLMADLAQNEVGLIITGHAYVLPEGQAGPWQLGVYKDDLKSGLKEMTKAVHQSGGKIVMQIAHAGAHAVTELTRSEPLGPSSLEGSTGQKVRAMTQDEIQETVQAFGQAALRAKESGFDGVQIHAAHGYFLSQFLSPFYNHRQDQYGGGPENRSRIIIQVYRSIRQLVGQDFPIMIKINSEDFLAQGLCLDDMLYVSSILEQEGIDAVELSGGTPYSGDYIPIRKGGLQSQDKEVYYREAARRYKKRISVPLILVGGIRSYPVAEGLVENKEANFISLCRPLIREPSLVKRWKDGDMRPSECVSDNLCFIPARKGQGIYCLSREREEKRG